MPQSIDKGKLALLMLAAVAVLAVGEAVIARGMRQVGESGGGWLAGARAAAGNPWVVGGVLLLGLHLAMYATALAGADLSLVMPLTAAAYPLSTLLARFFLHEEVHPARWLGTLVITAGVVLVAWGEARGG
jgi:drug/metabolite transporter (DMT)-like permease